MIPKPYLNKPCEANGVLFGDPNVWKSVFPSLVTDLRTSSITFCCLR